MIQCIIFDCDGTLVDSEKIGNQVVIDMFADFGITLPVAEYHQQYRGVNLFAIIADLEDRHQLKTGEDFIPRYRQQLNAAIEATLQPIPGVKDLLDELTLPRCVATSAPQDKMRLCLGVTGLIRYFGENLFSAYDINSWKPEPDLFLHAAKTMGYRPEECVVVEDSPVGVAAGLAAGMKTIHFNHNGTHQAIAGAIPMQQMDQLPSLLV